MTWGPHLVVRWIQILSGNQTWQLTIPPQKNGGFNGKNNSKWCGFSISMFDYPSAASWAIGETLPAPFMAYAALEQPKPNDNHGLLG